MSDDNDIGGAFFGLGFGVWAFFNGFQVFRKKQLMDNIPTSTVRGMAMGLVELNGTAERAQSLVAPFTAKSCVAYDYKVERYERRGKNSQWVTIASGNSFMCPFYINDGTGSVLVMPAGNEFIVGVDFTFTTGWGTPPENLTEFMRKSGISRGLFNNETLRFSERNIEPGDKVFVLGSARKLAHETQNLDAHRNQLGKKLEELKSDPKYMQSIDENKDGNISDDEWQKAVAKVEQELLQNELATGQGKDLDDVVIAKGDVEKTFIISDESQKQLDASMGWQIAGGVFGGAVIAVFCLWYLLTRFHII